MHAYKLEKSLNPPEDSALPIVEVPEPGPHLGVKAPVSRQILRRWRRRGIRGNGLGLENSGLVKIGG